MGNIKYLVVNGCSFTTDHKDPEGVDPDRPQWGFELAKKLDISVESLHSCYQNLARGGAGNDYIYSTTIDYLKNTDLEILQQTLFVICWSFTDRIRVPQQECFTWENHPNMLSLFNPTKNKKWFIQRSANYVIGLHNIFKSLKIKNYNFFVEKSLKDKMSEYHKFIDNKCFMLDKAYHATHQQLDNKDFLQIDYVRGDGTKENHDLHPGKKSIEIAANILEKRIQKNV
jgi:hypothetical protein